MGHGIAQVAAGAGYKVLLRDVDRDSLARGIEAIERNLAKGIQLGKLTEYDRDSTLQHIRGTTRLEEIANADLIIEAAPEQLKLKQEILRELETHSGKAFVFATNTSSLSITEIAKASARPQNVVGMHFFNPVAAMKLVEIVRGRETGDEAVDRARAFAGSVGKTSVVVRDSPGFATSRLGIVLGLEAMRMVEQGVASPADIDTAMKLGYGHPMGPLELTDLVGLDVRLGIAEYLTNQLGDTFRPPQILRDKVAANHLGKKTGQGFYKWSADGKRV